MPLSVKRITRKRTRRKRRRINVRQVTPDLMASRQVLKDPEILNRVKQMALNQLEERGLMLQNLSSLRRMAFREIFDKRRDIDAECGYPGRDELTIDMYRYLFDREGIGTRVVKFYPEECWGVKPEVQENEDPEETPFEEAWKALQKKRNLWHWLHRIDILSGIGRFGILLLGFNDGAKKLDQPVRKPRGGKPLELLYLRALDESVVRVGERDNDITSERYGQPLSYVVDFVNEDMVGGHGERQIQTKVESHRVHWTRVLHVADNRETSEVYGTPRQQVVFNRLMDHRKIVSGAGEMFWKGAFPGYAFEVDPDLGIELTDDEKQALKDEIENYANGLQRYMTLEGLMAKSLAPQVADPQGHHDVVIECIAITLGCPKRKFIGSEQAQLASGQDARTWNTRVARRQNEYVTPMIIRPFIDHLIMLEVLPEPAEGPDAYDVEWPDLNTQTDEEKATVIEKMVKALAAYVAGSVDQLIPPAQFFTEIMNMDPETVEEIMKAAEEFQDELEKEMEEELKRNPPEPTQGFAGGPEPNPQGGKSDQEIPVRGIRRRAA